MGVMTSDHQNSTVGSTSSAGLTTYIKYPYCRSSAKETTVRLIEPIMRKAFSCHVDSLVWALLIGLISELREETEPELEYTEDDATETEEESARKAKGSKRKAGSTGGRKGKVWALPSSMCPNKGQCRSVTISEVSILVPWRWSNLCIPFEDRAPGDRPSNELHWPSNHSVIIYAGTVSV